MALAQLTLEEPFARLSLEELMDQVRDAPDGEKEIPAFDELYHRTKADLLHKLTRMTGEHHLGEDLASSVWKAIWTRRETWRPPDPSNPGFKRNFNAWQSTIARKTFATWLGNRKDCVNPLVAMEVYQQMDRSVQAVIRLVFWPTPRRNRKNNVACEYDKVFQLLDSGQCPGLPSHALLTYLRRGLHNPPGKQSDAAQQVGTDPNRVKEICSGFLRRVRTPVRHDPVEANLNLAPSSNPSDLLDIAEVMVQVYWTPAESLAGRTTGQDESLAGRITQEEELMRRCQLVIRWRAWPLWTFLRRFGGHDLAERTKAIEERERLLMEGNGAHRPSPSMGDYLCDGLCHPSGKYAHAADEIGISQATAFRDMSQYLRRVAKKLRSIQ